MSDKTKTALSLWATALTGTDLDAVVEVLKSPACTPEIMALCLASSVQTGENVEVLFRQVPNTLPAVMYISGRAGKHNANRTAFNLISAMIISLCSGKIVEKHREVRGSPLDGSHKGSDEARKISSETQQAYGSRWVAVKSTLSKEEIASIQSRLDVLNKAIH
jgi:hypothetical protein